MNSILSLKNDFANITLLPMFEIQVIDKKTNSIEYIIFDIELIRNTIYALHEPLNAKQVKSKKIAYQKIVLDDCFSLDEHLQDLHSNCIEAICESEFFELFND